MLSSREGQTHRQTSRQMDIYNKYGNSTSSNPPPPPHTHTHTHTCTHTLLQGGIMTKHIINHSNFEDKSQGHSKSTPHPPPPPSPPPIISNPKDNWKIHTDFTFNKRLYYQFEGYTTAIAVDKSIYALLLAIVSNSFIFTALHLCLCV